MRTSYERPSCSFGGAALLMAGCSESDPATEGLGAAPDGEVEFVFDLSAARAAIGEDGSG